MDMALQSVPVPNLAKERADRTRTLRRFRIGDNTFRIMTQCSAIAVLVLLAGVMLSLVIGSLPAWKAFGFGFFTSESWNPVTEKFGALPAIYGTVLTSFIAMLIGVPVSLGIAIFLTEICPERLRRPIGIAVELLAGIPSIIYGIWGLFVFAPWFQVHVQPLLIDGFANIPLLNQLFAGPPYGIGMLTAGLILAIMVLPFITSITREVFETVPPVLKEAAYGIGCTRWEVMRRVVIPYTRVGIIGGVMLGLGRALGETMAVTFVIGNAHRIVPSILAPGTTISATIANEFTEAVGDLYTSSLVALGLILFLITFVIGNAHRIVPSILAPGTTISASIANEFTEAVGDLYTSSLVALGLILFFITFIVLAAARLMLMRIEQKAGT
jgi:phosphate transport system permease protein